MKNQSLVVLVFLGVLGIISCGQGNSNSSTKNQNSTDSLTYKIESFNKTEQNCNKGICDTSYVKAQYPVFAEKELNDFVLNTIAFSPLSNKVSGSLALAADSFLTKYLSFKKEYPESRGGYQWDQSLAVNYQNKDIITFKHTNYSYTGGAHGSQSILFYNLSKKNNSVITLNELLKANYQAELTKIGEEIFRKNEKLKPNDNLEGYFFENQKFALNNNFLITPNGLLFLYNQYEIKAYAFGVTELLIPYTSIKQLIAEDSILQNFY